MLGPFNPPTADELTLQTTFSCSTPWQRSRAQGRRTSALHFQPPCFREEHLHPQSPSQRRCSADATTAARGFHYAEQVAPCPSAGGWGQVHR